MTVSKRSAVHERHLLVALFPTQREAKKAVERLIDRDFPMDMLSVLGKVESAGDDLLGIYDTDVGNRMKGWGALWGLLAGAAGMFVIPGLGGAEVVDVFPLATARPRAIPVAGSSVNRCLT